MTTALRVPLVVFGYLVERLRRLPIAGSVLRHTSVVAAGLIVAAVVALGVWGGTVAPQRVGIADLVVGNLPAMQTWIIVSGDLSAGTPNSSMFRYVLTDPAVQNARMNVLSEVELPVGHTTVSGTYTGGREPVPLSDLVSGYTWIGAIRADPVLAAELGPPWASLGLLAAAVLIVAAGRVSYPMFFGQTPRSDALRAMTAQVGIRRGPNSTAGQVVPGTLVLTPGAPVELRVSGGGTQQLRLHSVRTGVEVCELRHIYSSEPALRVQPATGELTLTFASPDERDAAFAALIADAAEWSPGLMPRPTGSAHGELL